jgi:hypothetical protein
MAPDLWPSIRLHGIRLLIIKHQDIKLLGLMHHDTMHLSISGLSSDLYQPIIVAPQRSNLSDLEGLSRWKKIYTTVNHLAGCRA